MNIGNSVRLILNLPTYIAIDSFHDFLPTTIDSFHDFLPTAIDSFRDFLLTAIDSFHDFNFSIINWNIWVRRIVGIWLLLKN